MSIQLNEEAAWTIGLVSVAFLICIGEMHGCHQVESTKRAAYNAGLEEVQLEGSVSVRLGTPTAHYETQTNATRQ